MRTAKNISLLLATIAMAGIAWNTLRRISHLSEYRGCRVMLPMARLESSHLKEKMDKTGHELAKLTHYLSGMESFPVKKIPIPDDKKEARDLPAQIAALEAEQRKLKTDLHILISLSKSKLSKGAEAAKREGGKLYGEATILREQLRELKNRLKRIVQGVKMR